MRLPLVPDISTKDGTATKNARMYNVFSEKKPTGQEIAQVRPGITQYAAVGTAAAGQGVANFLGTFCAIYGAKLYKPADDSLGAGLSITGASVTLPFDFATPSGPILVTPPNFWGWGWTSSNFFFMNSVQSQPYK